MDWLSWMLWWSSFRRRNWICICFFIFGVYGGGRGFMNIVGS